jgi:hypothetical protein
MSVALSSSHPGPGRIIFFSVSGWVQLRETEKMQRNKSRIPCIIFMLHKHTHTHTHIWNENRNGGQLKFSISFFFLFDFIWCGNLVTGCFAHRLNTRSRFSIFKTFLGPTFFSFSLSSAFHLSFRRREFSILYFNQSLPIVPVLNVYSILSVVLSFFNFFFPFLSLKAN